ncbi:TetR/AcrR family transcriptional regulator, partial [Singulisphaera rosea]
MGKKLHETRERLLRQGLALLSQEGLAGVTIGQLAERVGMSKSGVFAHFRSKDEVQIGLLDHMGQFASALVVAPAMAFPE